MLLSQDQRFSCQQCGKCCRRTTVPVTAGEAETYRKFGVERLFDEGDGSEGAARDPFEPIPGYEPLLRIRKRPDGACGFLSPTGLCRIHETMGFDKKPVACQLFPFSFHPAEGGVVVTTSFACPAVIANEGDLLRSQARELRTLHTAWSRAHPEPARRVEFVAGHVLSPPVVTALRGVLTKVIDRPGADGQPDLRDNLRRLAVFLDDLTRPGVRQLAPDAFAEYVNVMGRHAMTSPKPPPQRTASRLSRLLFRGFLLAALSVQVRLDKAIGDRPTTLRLTLFQLLAHLHGLAPGTARFDLRRATAMPLDLNADGIHAIAHRYLHVSFETVGTGRRTLTDEVTMIVARLNAACVLARMHAAASGKQAVDRESFTQGLLESADLAHADDGGTFSSLLTTLSGGMEALYLFPPMYSYAHG